MVRLGRLWTSTLCLLTISGLLTVGALPLLPEGFRMEMLSPSQTAFYIPVEIINYKFTPAMLNSESKEYKDMYKDVTTLFNGVYNCDDCPTNSFYGGVAAMTFSPGSVIANAIVVFNSYSINNMVAVALFQRNAEEAAPKNLQLNMAYTSRDKVEPVVLPETTATTTPTITTTTPTTTTTTPTTTTTTPTTTPTTTTTTPTTTTTTPTTTPTTTTTTPTTTTTTPTTTTPTPTTTTPKTTPTTTTPSTTTPTTTPTTLTPAITPAITIDHTITTTPTTTPTTTTTPSTTPMPTATTKPATFTTTPAIATGDSITTTPTTTPTTSITEKTTEAITSTLTTSPEDALLSTTTNPGNHSDSHTSHGVHPTQDPAGSQTTTMNPHGQTDPQSSDPQTTDGGSDNGSNDLVPGWGIALLVLAAAILLLLIIIFIMMLVRWCCKKTESGHKDAPEDPYYPEKKQLPQEALPVYSPQAPVSAPVTQGPNSSPVMIEDTPKKNKSGFYAVNP